MKFPSETRRLIEVDFPLLLVNEYSSIEKKKRTATLGSVHVWWARRPLSACRAVLLASLLPDPADVNLPKDLEAAIRARLQAYAGKRQARFDAEGDSKTKRLKTPEDARHALLTFIGEFSDWEKKLAPDELKLARELLEICYGDELPRVIDPFAGGGSIPLEAARLGLPVVASDLNPIPLMLNQLQLQQLPRVSEGFVDEVEEAALRINSKLDASLREFYPIENKNDIPIGYICARQIQCEGVGCGRLYPLLTSGWLTNSKKNLISWKFSLGKKNEVVVSLVPNPKKTEVPTRTVQDGNATCPICNYTTPVESVRRQMRMRRGGSRDARLLAVIGKIPGEDGRTYRLPTAREVRAHEAAAARLVELEKEDPIAWDVGESLPDAKTLGFRVQGYGMERWSDLYSPRQLLTQLYLCKFIRELELADEVRTVLALVASKLADRNSTLAGWDPSAEEFGRTFGMQTVQMSWDFFENNPANTEGGVNWMGRVTGVLQGLDAARIDANRLETQVLHASATRHPLPDETQDFYFTDPPYYAAVPYANLSDFFIVWLKRCVTVPWLQSGLAPKDDEAIMDPNAKGADGAVKTGEWFEQSMAQALGEGRRLVRRTGMGCVVFAHTSTEGWARMLSAIVRGGWTVTASWPISSEMSNRLRAQKSAALRTSIHIVMRPRPEDAGVGDWRAIQSVLPGKINVWMRRLTAEGIVGADAVFSCIGPAIELFSEWERVERSDGSIVDIDSYLVHVWNVVAHEALKTVLPESAISDIPEDARFAVITLWTLRTSGASTTDGEIAEGKFKQISSELQFDTARLLAQGIGADLEALSSRRGLVKIIKKDKGAVVKLLSPLERKAVLFDELDTQPDSSVGIAKPTVQARLGEDTSDVKERSRAEEPKAAIRTRTVTSPLDLLHQAMLLHADGHTNALDHVISDEIGESPIIWQLAQTLNALYLEGTWERNKIEGVIARHESLSRGN